MTCTSSFSGGSKSVIILLLLETHKPAPQTDCTDPAADNLDEQLGIAVWNVRAAKDKSAPGNNDDGCTD